MKACISLLLVVVCLAALVNATFEDSSGKRPEFDVTANADKFIAKSNA